jgi:NADH:ubiquinone oxidoreductase subunit B-like Fe-S oxidoreductase
MRPWYKKEDIMTRIYFVESSCCAPELLNLFASRYDPERLNIIKANDISEADILIVAGFVSEKLGAKLMSMYNSTKYKPEIIAFGGCAINGGPLNSPQLELPFSMYVPGCPPKPEALLDAVIKLKKRLHA